MSSAAERAERDARIAEMVTAGVKPSVIAARLQVSRPRVSQILKRLAEKKVVVRQNHADRADEMLALYECGFRLSEISERLGIATSTISITLQGHPDYRPRQGGRPLSAEKNFDVPRWVPAVWVPRYEVLAHRHNEHVAASCVRRGKAMGVTP